MTVVAVIFVPIVLLYQGWTYWVFRHRLGRDDFEGTPTPIAVLSSLGREGASAAAHERPLPPPAEPPATA
jgi:hypothetical protein